MSESIQPERGPNPGSERRASVRQRFHWDVACELATIGTSERWPAQIRDISVDGMGLVIGTCFPPGTIVEVELNSRDGSLSYVVVARINHSRQVAEGEWLAGCSLVDKMSDDEMRGLL